MVNLVFIIHLPWRIVLYHDGHIYLHYHNNRQMQLKSLKAYIKRFPLDLRRVFNIIDRKPLEKLHF